MRAFFHTRLPGYGKRFGGFFQRTIVRVKTWRRLQVHRGEEDRALLRRLRTRAFPSPEQWMELARVLTARVRVVFYVSFACLATGAAILAFQGFKWLRVPVPAPGGIYTEAVPGAPRFIQPIFAASDVDRDLVALVFDPLFRVSAAGALTPALATAYEVSPNGRVITVHLRNGATWHDGVPITARDVVFTVRRIQDPEWRSPLVGDFLGVNVQAVNSTTVRFTLNESFAPFLSNLDLAIAPEHVWKDATSSTARRRDENLAPVGSGPYEFKEIKKDVRGGLRSMHLVRHSAYYGTTPHIDEVVIKFFGDRAEAVASFGKNQANGLGFVPVDDVAAALRGRSARVIPYEIPQYLAVFWNTEGPGALRDAAVRRAFGAAVDRERIWREVWESAGRLVSGPIPEGALGVPQAPAIPFDPVSAAEALAAAGWVAVPPAVVRTKASDTLAFALTTVDEPALIRTAERVRSDLGLVGAAVTLDVVPASRIHAERIKGRSYEALLIGELIGADPDPYPFWHGSQAEDPGVNLSKYRNKDADRLLEEARTTLDVPGRAKRYDAFQKKLFDDVPALFLLQSPYQTIVADDVYGVMPQQIASPDHRLWDVVNWYVKVKRVWRWKR